MSNKIVNAGLDAVLARWVSVAVNGPPAGLISMAIDDKNTAFLQTDTTLGSPTNIIAHTLDTTTEATQVLNLQGTFPTTDTTVATIRRITVHNIAAGSVTGVSTSLQIGIDTQTFAKDGTFGMIFKLQVTATTN